MMRKRVSLAIMMVVLLTATVAGFSCAGKQGPQGEQGPEGPNMIVAMGAISSSGTVVQGYNVDTGESTWKEEQQAYLITLTGINYSWPEYITIVTPTSHWVTACGNTDVEGQLYVRLLDSDGNPIQGYFTFVVLQVPS